MSDILNKLQPIVITGPQILFNSVPQSWNPSGTFYRNNTGYVALRLQLSQTVH